MARMFYEDAYCLGLLYVYSYGSKKMVLKDDLDNFYDIIESNLKNMNSSAMDVYSTVWYDNDPSIYFVSEGKNGEIYYVLKPDFDIERAKSKYIGCLSTDILVASQKENALNSIGLAKKDGRIVRKEINVHVGISSAGSFMNRFMELLKSGELKIETCPQVEVGHELTEEYIIEQLDQFSKLLDSGIINEVTDSRDVKVKKKLPNK